MKFLCLNSQGMEGILVTGKIYSGELHPHNLYLHIFRGEDKHHVFCNPDRFSVVVDTVLLDEPQVKINHYTLTVD